VRIRKGRRPPPPKGPELAYEAALRAYSGALAKAVRAAVKRPLATLRKEQRADAKDFASLDFGLLRIRLGRIAASEASDLVDRYGARITNWNRSTLSEILGIPVSSQTPEVKAALAQFQRENVDLITSIHERLLDDVESVVSEATARGTRVETLAARLAERYGVSDSRAELIARDQTLKFNASLTQIRFAEAGVTRYVWSSSRDERVRPMHAALEGRVFSFDDPPVTNEDGDTNNPGTDFQCRCTAIPVLDDTPTPETPAAVTGERGTFDVTPGGVRSTYREL
jgi:SPP1 gp7 family putative phage head morphogenesis protein